MSTSTRLEAPRNVFRTVEPKIDTALAPALLQPPNDGEANADGRGRGTVFERLPVSHSLPELSALRVGKGLQRRANAALRVREYLTPSEVEKLISAARSGRYGHRDATLILIAYRHGLRASEIADLEWSQVEFGRAASLHVRRVKNGKPSVHPLRGDELRALREQRRQNPDLPICFSDPRARPSVDPAHDQIHAIERGAVQRLLEIGGLRRDDVEGSSARRGFGSKPHARLESSKLPIGSKRSDN